MAEFYTPEFIGTSRLVADLRDDVQRIARSDARVLITGEPGTGKGLIARRLHAQGPRAKAPFASIDCARLPEPALESELFGRGGDSLIHGRGTLFLDSVGDMSVRIQALLVRHSESCNVRLLAATHRHLPDLISGGQFRQDLYYRLNVVHVAVPPLRDHLEDIPGLVDHFLRRLIATRVADGDDTYVRRISPHAMTLLAQYSWPGNVRQLRTAIETLVAASARESIEPEDLPSELAASAPVRPGHDLQLSRVTERLFRRLSEGESFWTSVYPLYMKREITKDTIRELVHRGLGEARGNYRIVMRMFNMGDADYKRFLNFLRKQGCQLPYKEYRQYQRREIQ